LQAASYTNYRWNQKGSISAHWYCSFDPADGHTRRRLRGTAILCGLSLFFALRCLVGLIYLAQGKPYPRPQTWLI